jgi:hypothetical protein
MTQPLNEQVPTRLRGFTRVGHQASGPLGLDDFPNAGLKTRDRVRCMPIGVVPVGFACCNYVS